MIKRVAIVTNGGDAPGLNAVINAIVKTAEKNDVEVYGYLDGYRGILEDRYIRLRSRTTAKNIISRGGTIIGTSNNVNLFKLKKLADDGTITYEDMSDYCAKKIKDNGFDVVFSLGGDGTQKSARDFSKKGIHFIGIPKTIDNDLATTDLTFGFQTAVQTATDAVDRLITTADAHDRIMVLEVMGRYAGWIALYTAIAGGVDACLIPEIPYDLEIVAKKIRKDKANGKDYSLVIVSEGAVEKGGELIVKTDTGDREGIDNLKLGGAGEYVAKRLEELTGIESRSTTLGYIQRGGTPTANDRILSSRYGTKAMEFAMNGIKNVLVTLKDGKICYSSLDEVVGNNTEIGAISGNTKESNIRKVPVDSELIETARNLMITFGDEAEQEKK